jgi:hypothetical protein
MDDIREESHYMFGLDVGEGWTSIQLENLSMGTNRCVKPPSAFCRGPTRSNPHIAKGQVIEIVCKALTSRCVSFV